MPVELNPSGDQFKRWRNQIGKPRAAVEITQRVRREVGTPIWDELMEGRCFNCWMPHGIKHDYCGCCQGCGEIDADVNPKHPTGGWCTGFYSL